jgi:2-polyprenyl-3-methyl-5-hydroxy-6-metoxy-1,4-benzoquinol methylase
MRKQRDHRRKDAVRDVTGEIGPEQAEDRGRNEAGDSDDHAGEKPLSHATILPSSFVVRWAHELARIVPPRRRALDLAMGHGRHALVLHAAGFRVFGVDIRFEAVRDAVAAVENRGGQLRAWCADLTAAPLPRERFELILVTRYLQRALFASLKAALTPGGAIVYETFTEAQCAQGRGPTSPEHLLRPGELRGYFADFDVLFEEETNEPEALARVVAQRRFAIRRGIRL